MRRLQEPYFTAGIYPHIPANSTAYKERYFTSNPKADIDPHIPANSTAHKEPYLSNSAYAFTNTTNRIITTG